jgi:hypothetical protein
MNSRTRTTRALALATMAALGVLALAGCDLPGVSGKPAGAAPAASAAPSAPNPDASNPAASAGPSKPAGAKPSTSAPARKNGLPDPCELLSRAEVTALAGGKQITQVDRDSAKPTDTTRFCQWQLSGARLAVFLSGTTKERFAQQKTAQTHPVTGIGDDAFSLAGHLYVRHGNLQVDVYASSGNNSDAQNLQLEKAVAEKILPRL